MSSMFAKGSITRGSRGAFLKKTHGILGGQKLAVAYILERELFDYIPVVVLLFTKQHSETKCMQGVDVQWKFQPGAPFSYGTLWPFELTQPECF